jgi:hypothetical protein
MGRITIDNRANVPIHVQLSNANFIYFHQNYVQPQTRISFADVAAIGWDFNAVFACTDTEIDPSQNNKNMGINVGLLVIGAIATAAGIAVTIATAGAATPLVIGGVEVTGAALGAVIAASAVAAGGSGTATIGGFVVTLLPGTAKPAGVNGLYGGYDYNIYIDGTFTQAVNTATSTINVTPSVPLTCTWKNFQTGNNNSSDTGFSSP